MRETVTDMLPDESLGSKMNPRTPTRTAGADAGKTASAMSKGGKFWCSRIRADVTPRTCCSKYTYAKAQKIVGSPCLECAKVLVMLKSVPETEIKIEEVATMSKPAKKGTPDPIALEVKNVTEPKLEIVTKPVPDVKEKAASFTDPFNGWDQYAPGAAKRSRLDVFVSFTAAGILSLSVAAQDQLNLELYSSVDILHAPGKIGLRLHPGKKGALSIVAKTKNHSSATVSARGFLRQFKLEDVYGKRFAVREIAPGFVEIDLGREVAA